MKLITFSCYIIVSMFCHRAYSAPLRDYLPDHQGPDMRLLGRDWDYISDWGPGVIENTWTGTTGVQPDASDMPPPPPPIHSSSAQPSDSTPVSPASQVNPNAGYPSELQASQHKYHDPPPVSPRSSVDNQLTRRWSIYDLPWDTSTVDKLYGSGAGIRPSPPPYPPSSQVQSDSLNSKGAT